MQNYKRNQENNKRLHKKGYYNYYLEEIKNKYGKIVEYKIVDLKHKSKNRKQASLVFTKKDGRYSGTDILRYPFKIIHEDLNIKNCRFYDLRGSFATISLRNGCEIKDVVDILGHSKVETTKDYYISSLVNDKKRVVELFEEKVKIKH